MTGGEEQDRPTSGPKEGFLCFFVELNDVGLYV